MQVAGVPITAALLRKHDRPGPRYTSYPTAVEFHAGVGEAAYLEKLAQADALAQEPLSFYFHLPFCHERCTFCGCHVTITKRTERATEYLSYLEREVDLVAQRLPHRRQVAQYHWGGGTPTYHPPEELRQLHRVVTERFEILPNAEVAIEVDPRVTSHAHVDALVEMGFNRISMGVQDFTPAVQEIINRFQDFAGTKDLVDYCRQRGIGSINIDMIYGLPLQTPASFGASLDQVIGLRPERVAMYSFAFVPWKQGNQRILTADMTLPPELKMELYLLGLEKFTSAGYRQIGMDHFALPEDELAHAQEKRILHRNFQGYTTKPATDTIAFGISGIGDLQGAYVQNLKEHGHYQEAIKAGRLPVYRGVLLSRDDVIRRHIITQLMCNFYLDWRDVERRFELDFRRDFARELQRLAEPERDGFVELGADSITVQPLGRLFIRNLCMIFDRYLDPDGRKDGSTPVFSRTI
jgi:oxygen-independent coproporphyrinogen III oxidase